MIQGMFTALMMLYGYFVTEKVWGKEESKKHWFFGFAHMLLLILWFSMVILCAYADGITPSFIGGIVYIIAYPALIFYQWKKEMPGREAREAARLEAERNKEQD